MSLKRNTSQHYSDPETIYKTDSEYAFVTFPVSVPDTALGFKQMLTIKYIFLWDVKQVPVANRGEGAMSPLRPAKDYPFFTFGIKSIQFFPNFALLCSAYNHFCNILLTFIVQKFSRFTLFGISFLNSCKLVVNALPVALGFTYFRGTRCTPKLIFGKVCNNIKISQSTM